MIRIFDSSLNFLGFLDIFNSFQCSQKYADTGSFSIKALMTDKTNQLLKAGNIISYKEFAGIIDSVQITEEAGSYPIISASGYDLVGLLLSRIIWTDTYYSGKSEEFLRKMVDENAINPTDTNRIIPFLALGDLSGLPQTTERNTENETLLAECQKVCRVADYGFSIGLDINQKQMKFKVYQGEDRTAGQPHQVIIGKEFDNVQTQDYTYSNKDEITTVLVKAEEASVSVGADAAGFNRKETVVKSSKKQEELTESQFSNVLISEGKEKLNSITECFDIDIYNASLTVGDLVTVRDKSWSITFNTRVTEKQTALQSGVETITYLLGNDITLTEVKR